MSYRMTLDVKGERRIANAMAKAPGRITKAISEAINSASGIVYAQMRNQAPVDTGMLRENIYRNVQPYRAEIGPDLTVTPYALYVHEGTEPYVITPTTGRAMRWEDEEGVHYASIVQHPGLEANPFVERTYNKTKDKVEALFIKKVDNAVENIAQDSRGGAGQFTGASRVRGIAPQVEDFAVNSII